MIGSTRDDAAGEAFDKVARMLGLPYPGGPQISRLAGNLRVKSRKSKVSGGENLVKLPRPMIHTKDFDFSFSGLKTAVLYYLRDHPEILASSAKAIKTKQNDGMKAEVAREFEDAVIDVLLYKTFKAVKKHNVKSIIKAGGVSANKELRSRFMKESKKLGLSISFPGKNLSTDNAVMIALAGYYAKEVPLSSKKLIAKGNLSI